MASRGNPVFTVRLTRASHARVAEIAGIFGAPNVRAFARELIETVCSGDAEKISRFNGRLFERMTGQLQLDLQAANARKSYASKKTIKSVRKRVRRV